MTLRHDECGMVEERQRMVGCVIVVEVEVDNVKEVAVVVEKEALSLRPLLFLTASNYFQLLLSVSPSYHPPPPPPCFCAPFVICPFLPRVRSSHNGFGTPVVVRLLRFSLLAPLHLSALLVLNQCMIPQLGQDGKPGELVAAGQCRREWMNLFLTTTRRTTRRTTSKGGQSY